MSSDRTIQDILQDINNPKIRVSSLAQDFPVIFDFWLTNDNFHQMIDTYKSTGIASEIYSGAEGIYANLDKNVKSAEFKSAMQAFVVRVLIPRIKTANEDNNLTPFLWPASSTVEFNELNLYSGDDPTSNPVIELKYKYAFLEALINRMNEGGNQLIEGMSEEGDQVIETTANMLNQIIILFFQLAINSALILKLIQETEVDSFKSDTFQMKIKTIIMVIFRIINNLLEVTGLKSAVISVSKKIFNMFLCFVIVCIMIKTGIGAYLIKLIFNGFLIILNYFFSDVYDSYFETIKTLLTDKIFITIDDLITNYFINFFKNKLLNGEFLEWFKTTVHDITRPLIQGGVESLTDTIAKTSGETLVAIAENGQLIETSGQATLAAIAASSENTLVAIAARGDSIHAAIETSGQATLTAIAQSSSRIKPFLGDVAKRLALAAVGSSNPTKVFKELLDAFNNINPTEGDNDKIDEILKTLLDKSNVDVNSIFQGRLAQQQEIIINKVIDRLGEQGDPSIINNVLGKLFELLSNAAVSGITTAMISNPIQRLTNFYGGKKGKNKKSKTKKTKTKPKTKPKRKTKKTKTKPKRKTKKMKNKRRAKKIKKSKKI